MKKKNLKLLMLGLTIMFMGVINANAAGSASLKCASTNIKVGESTNCTVYASSTTEVTSFVAGLETSKYLKISNVSPNTGWTANSALTSETDISKLQYGFNFDATKATFPLNQEQAIFSFTLTLAEEAKNITAEECGRLCLNTAFINNASILENNSCYSPTIDLTEKNPETGAFMNYLVLGGCALVALVAILAINKNKKFYRV